MLFAFDLLVMMVFSVGFYSIQVLFLLSVLVFAALGLLMRYFFVICYFISFFLNNWNVLDLTFWTLMNYICIELT